MRIGSLVYATQQGLGILARAFHAHGVLTDVLVVRHAHHQTHDDWYPGAPQTPIRPFDSSLARSFCADMDVMLFLETPFDWGLIPWCREKGIKTVLEVMYECCPEHLPYQPDWFFCPSLLDQQYFPDRSVFLPVPVEVPWRQRTRAEVFVHNAGHGGLRGRNGTRELAEALKFMTSKATIIINTQCSHLHREIEPLVARASRTVDVHLFKGTLPQEKLYADSDVFVFPEKFNGLSLPLQEAFASGMLVMGTDRFPMNTWLPREPLIPVSSYHKASVGPSKVEFDEAEVSPRVIAERMDRWYGQDITAYSQAGKAWAEENSWERLKPRYAVELERIAST